MKFVHIGDLHIGKVIHQASLIDVQRELLLELLTYMDQQDIRLLVISGDVYDRFIPSQEAVNLLDEFLSLAILRYHIEILMISGNHDSSDRMHFASHILSESGLHIETYPKEEMVYVQKDQVRFYLLPFMKPSAVKNLFGNQDIHDYEEALRIYLSHQEIDSHYQNVLITHQFVGKSSQTSESEIPLSVGGTEIISPSLFKDFDYVALGHLHAPQSVSKETIRYCGSLMCYSFDEVNQNKSITIVDTENWSVEQYQLHPSRSLKKYQGTFQQLMDPAFIDKKDDYFAFVLENDQLIPHAIDQLRTLYPHLLQITYLRYDQEKEINQTVLHQISQTDTKTLFKNFYYEMKHQELSPLQEKMMDELIEEVGEEHENH